MWLPMCGRWVHLFSYEKRSSTSNIEAPLKKEHRPLSLDNSRCNINEGGGYCISGWQFSFLNFETQNRLSNSHFESWSSIFNFQFRFFDSPPQLVTPKYLLKPPPRPVTPCIRRQTRDEVPKLFQAFKLPILFHSSLYNRTLVMYKR